MEIENTQSKNNRVIKKKKHRSKYWKLAGECTHTIATFYPTFSRALLKREVNKRIHFSSHRSQSTLWRPEERLVRKGIFNVVEMTERRDSAM